jgi:hypothetical protein
LAVITQTNRLGVAFTHRDGIRRRCHLRNVSLPRPLTCTTVARIGLHDRPWVNGPWQPLLGTSRPVKKVRAAPAPRWLVQWEAALQVIRSLRVKRTKFDATRSMFLASNLLRGLSFSGCGWRHQKRLRAGTNGTTLPPGKNQPGMSVILGELLKLRYSRYRNNLAELSKRHPLECSEEGVCQKTSIPGRRRLTSFFRGGETSATAPAALSRSPCHTEEIS